MGTSIPDYGLKNEDGKQILNAEYRFNHMWYSSKLLVPYDNNTADDSPFTGPVTPKRDDRCWPEMDTIIPLPIL